MSGRMASAYEPGDRIRRAEVGRPVAEVRCDAGGSATFILGPALAGKPVGTA
jgi:hypothetical protein